MLDVLEHDYRWVETDVLSGATRTPEFLARNPAGQVPAMEFADGRVLAQSNAILLYLAEGTAWVPADRFTRARMIEWLFREQYSHEPYIAVARFQRLLAGMSADEIAPRLMQKGHAALARMEAALSGGGWLAGEAASLADVALVAYTRVAGEEGFDLAGYPAVRAWIVRVEAALGIG